MKRGTQGFSFVAALWLALLTLIAFVILLGALESARTFNETAFLQSQQMRRLTAMGAQDAITARLKPVRSVSGFGEGETALLWLNWLGFLRTYGVTTFAALVVVVVISSVWFLQRLDLAVISLIGSISPTLVIFSGIFASLVPEWLKSQPISVRRSLLMFALSPAVWVFLLGVGILLAIAVSRPETLNATKIAAFLVASIGTGLGMGFSAQATRFTWAAWIRQWNFTAVAWQVGIAVAFAFPWFVTLTSFWAVGLIVNLGFCCLMFKLAESKWHSLP